MSAPTYTSELRRVGSLWAARTADGNLEIGTNHLGGIVRDPERVVIERADVDDLLAIMWAEGSDAMKDTLAEVDQIARPRERATQPREHATTHTMTEAERLVYAVAYATTTLHLASGSDPDVAADVALEAVKALRRAPAVDSGESAELLRVFKESR